MTEPSSAAHERPPIPIEAATAGRELAFGLRAAVGLGVACCGLGSGLVGAGTAIGAAISGGSPQAVAEDNGSGKTRLMVIFQSGAAQQIAIEP